MFRATFLGNHGWLVRSERSALLVDPLLLDGYGWTESVGLRVWPPRRLELERFPRVDAVLLTHEHEGHFDLASLHRLDRRIPIHVPALSSLAMPTAIKEMGFTVHRVAPGAGFSAGDLDVVTMPGEHDAAWGEEWDNLAFLVRDQGGHGSLFSPVDVAPTRDMRRAVQAVVERPGLWAHTNNFSAWAFMHQRAEPPGNPLEKLVKNVFDYHRRLSDLWERPEALLLYGGGFSFEGERSFIDREIFPCDTFAAARALSLLLPGELVLAPVPGDTLCLTDGKLGSVVASDGVRALPREQWPRRGSDGAVTWLEDFAPACGRTDFPDGDVHALEDELRGFAAFLYSRLPFRSLYSLRAADVEGRKATIALRLRTDVRGGFHTFEYEPQACRFRRVESTDPGAEYLGVYECWATDLLAVLCAEISSPSLALARARHFAPRKELFDLDLFLMQYAHPLRHPTRFLDLYRRVMARLPAASPVIQAST